MGYHSRVTGELTITPPIRWVDYRDSPFRFDTDNHELSVAFREDLSDTHTDTGTTTTRSATAVTARSDDSGRFYSLLADLRDIAAGFGSDHRFDGWLVRIGEDQGDVERYAIRGTAVITEQAQLCWPDGTGAP